MISAPLGAKDKRGTFTWVLRQKVPDPADPERWVDGPANIFRQLQHMPRLPWRRSCDELHAALAEENVPVGQLILPGDITPGHSSHDADVLADGSGQCRPAETPSGSTPNP